MTEEWLDFSELEDVEPISFSTEDLDFEPAEQDLLRQWIEQIITQQGCQLNFLNYIFCSDDYLHKMNVEYLQHDTLTDIITFPYNDPPRIEGDIFISIDRVRDNARTFKVPFSDELHRVVIHGVLHLCGQGDKSPEEKGQMRAKEDEALELLKAIRQS